MWGMGEVGVIQTLHRLFSDFPNMVLEALETQNFAGSIFIINHILFSISSPFCVNIGHVI
jgi:hypothetical protein